MAIEKDIQTLVEHNKQLQTVVETLLKRVTVLEKKLINTSHIAQQAQHALNGLKRNAQLQEQKVSRHERILGGG